MTLIELKRGHNGRRFLFDFDSGWEIEENEVFGKPARWVNHKIGRNMDAVEAYDEIRGRLADLLVPTPRRGL